MGGEGPLRAGLELTREGGTVVLFAHAPEGGRADFDLNHLFKYERRVLGAYSGGVPEQERIFAAILDGRLDPIPLVTHRIPLDTAHLHYLELTVMGVYHHRPATVRAALELLSEKAFDAGLLLAAEEYPIELVEQALRRMIRKEAIKVVVRQ